MTLEDDGPVIDKDPDMQSLLEQKMENLKTEGSSEMEEDDDDTEWWQLVPLAICIVIFLAIIIWICVDWSGAMRVFN